LITGELVRLSGGIRVSGYGVVYERTIPASGKYTQEQKNLVNALLKAQDLAMKMIRPGVRNSEIHEVMQNSLASSLKELGLLKQTSDIHKFVFRQMVSHNAISEFESDPDYPLEAGAVLNLSPAVFIFPTTSVPKAYAGLAVAVSDAVVVSSTGADFLDHTLARTTGELELRTAEPSILDPILK
jgi:Xaa-Pro aminopeptidase